VAIRELVREPGRLVTDVGAGVDGFDGTERALLLIVVLVVGHGVQDTSVGRGAAADQSQSGLQMLHPSR